MTRLLGPLCFAVTVALTAPAGVAQEKDKKEPPKFEITADEKTILDLTNQERAKAGLPALKLNLVLSKVARGHSANMVRHGKMEHKLDGKSPGDRTKDGGYEYEVCGENVAESDKDYPLPKLMKIWMDSEVHRINILHKEYTELGVGIAVDSKGKLYYTQLFATPLP